MSYQTHTSTPPYRDGYTPLVIFIVKTTQRPFLPVPLRTDGVQVFREVLN